MNISFHSRDWRERVLSNLAHTPFSLRIGEETVACNSVEGFWQGLKSKGDMRRHIFLLSGLAAKSAGHGKHSPRFEIGGEVYVVGSPEHAGLIKAALRAKICQNPRAARALLESGGRLTHSVPQQGRPTFKMESMLRQLYAELKGSGELDRLATGA